MHRLLTGLFRFVTAILYRIQRHGAPVPGRGPVLLVANHPNGLVDPALLLHATRRPIRFLGKAPLLSMPVLGWIMRTMKVVPVYRAQDGFDTSQNERTFEAVYEALGAGDVVALFPEGVSHNEPALVRLKTGAARMVLGTDPRASGEVRIVPVGLVYSQKGTFRSRVTLWIGEPVQADELRLLHEQDERAAVVALTERIGDALERTTVNVGDSEDLPLIRLAERIWKPAEGSKRVERLAALADGWHRLQERDPERGERLRERIEEFQRALAYLDVSPGHIEVRYTPARVVLFVVGSALEALVGLPLSFLAIVYCTVPYQLVKRTVVLAKPTPDIVATVKGLAGLVWYPLWHGLVSLVIGWFAGPAWACAHLLLMPPVIWLGVRFWERNRSVLREAWIWARIAGSDRLRANLTRQRDAIVAEIDTLAREAAPG